MLQTYKVCILSCLKQQRYITVDKNITSLRFLPTIALKCLYSSNKFTQIDAKMVWINFSHMGFVYKFDWSQFCCVKCTLSKVNEESWMMLVHHSEIIVVGLFLKDAPVLFVPSLCSWVWCTACCRGAPASVPRRPTLQGLLSSRSWSRLSVWLWGSAPAPTAPHPWDALHARRPLPENIMTQYLPPSYPINPLCWSAVQEKHLSPAASHTASDRSL